MKLYKVRYRVTRYCPRKEGRKQYETVEDKTEVFTKLEGAVNFYEQCVNEAATYKAYPKTYEGFVELFVPHIFETGSLAYWPDDDKYIKKFHFERVYK